jgi:multidrug efflux pump subunit AcrB
MWIVRLALRRPYTFVVAAMLTMILGVVTVFRTPTDIFPNVDIPVVAVVWQFGGMSPDEMETRIVTPFERFAATTVNDIEHVESQSVNGTGVVKIFFQKTAKVEEAMSQITATAQTAVGRLPPGTQPPLIIRYSASSVPIMQLAVSSDTVPEQQLFDYTFQIVRNQLINIPGVLIPYPYGGKQRQVMVDLDPEKCYAWGISAQDVSNALNAQNLILPAGTTKIGTQEYAVRINSSPEAAADLNGLPIKTVNGTTVYIKDVANVRDGFQVQTNVVHTGGKRGVLMSVLKQGTASTLDVAAAVKAALPAAIAQLPAGVRDNLKFDLLFDQSVFVRASVTGVVMEAAIAAGLTALMILLFLGSWRSTLIVIVSIPLSIMVSIIILSFLGETLNVMTLGGMALAVGILVDDATVEIENIHRNLHQGKRLVRAILDGAQQIAVPAFVATLCICIVFVPVVFISGAAKFLFTPLALAVVFAMMTSYLLSRTLVPTMVHYLLAGEVEMYGGQLDPDDPHAAKALAHKGHAADAEPQTTFGQRVRARLASRGVRIGLIVTAVVVVATVAVLKTQFPAAAAAVWAVPGMAWAWVASNPLSAAAWLLVVGAAVALLVLVGRYNLIWRTHYAFNRQFERVRRRYGGLLAWALAHRALTAGAFLLLVAASLAVLVPTVGQDFFPAVDAGQIRMHVRAPAGTRIEQTEVYFGKVADAIRKRIPAAETETMLDNIGIPNSGINIALSDGTLMSPADGEILVALAEGHRPTDEYVKLLRKELPKEFPELTFFFQPPDIVTQVLNFGLSSPIDVQVSGPLWNDAANARIAREMMADLRGKPGIVDLHLQQVRTAPDFRVAVDRTLAGQVGLTQRDVAQNMLISLSGTLQAAPNFWLDPRTGISYNVIVQAPQYRTDSVNALENLPVQAPAAGAGGGGGMAGGDADAGGPRPSQLLGNLSTVTRGMSASNITHYDIKRTSDVLMNVAGTDLGRAGGHVREVVAKYEPQLPKGSKITLRGQIESMSNSFTGLGLGLIFAILLVYLLMVINFQSWVDPLIILMALPGAAAGILWMLFATGTTISVPALMGSIMAVGVATANSILMVTFANDQRKDFGMNAHDAALTAGLTRLRPVMMTALAMIIGMLPMSLGLGEGGEQNAPLGRAVIGGLLMATFGTLFFVPVVYSALRQKAPQTRIEPELREPGDPHEPGHPHDDHASHAGPTRGEAADVGGRAGQLAPAGH